MTITERFTAKFFRHPLTGCWIWTASTTHNGYGRIHNGRTTKKAHRVAYEMYVGPIPDGLELDHLCRVRRCVNPAHMEAVTHAENMRRGDAGKPEASKTHCPQGHPYDEANTWRESNGKRHCRACWRIRGQARKAA